MFFTYVQNNSYGRYETSVKDGIGSYVIIEARNAKMANALAQSIGIYFDGVAAGIDCACCGDRWDETYEDEGRETPQINGSEVGDYTQKWGGESTFVHYLDGRVVNYG